MNFSLFSAWIGSWSRKSGRGYERSLWCYEERNIHWLGTRCKEISHCSWCCRHGEETLNRSPQPECDHYNQSLLRCTLMATFEYIGCFVFVCAGLWPQSVDARHRGSTYQTCGETAHGYCGQLPHPHRLPGSYPLKIAIEAGMVLSTNKQSHTCLVNLTGVSNNTYTS